MTTGPVNLVLCDREKLKEKLEVMEPAPRSSRILVGLVFWELPWAEVVRRLRDQLGDYRSRGLPLRRRLSACLRY